MGTEKKTGNFALRMSDQLREDVRMHAGLNGRSMNAEIVYLIEKGMQPTPSLNLSKIHDAELLTEVHRRFKAAITVNIELTEAQLSGVKKFHERDENGDLVDGVD